MHFHCRAKRIKANLTVGKELKNRREERIFCGSLKDSLARKPYGLPGQRSNLNSEVEQQDKHKSSTVPRRK
jgi:hypothetical protein